MSEQHRVICGDALEVLRGLPDASVDAIITDSPYGVTSLAFDKQVVPWADWWEQVRRVATDAAPIVMFAQQPFTTDLISSNRRMFRYNLVWHKSMPTGFLDANARPLRAHEDILVFGKRGATGSSKRRMTYNPQMAEGDAYVVTRLGQVAPEHYGDRPRQTGSYTHRHPQSVLRYRSGTGRGREGHPTQKPLDLLEWLVLSYSNPGELVLDPFAGSGTTAAAAVRQGRRSLSVELDPRWAETARERIARELAAREGDAA